LQGKNLNPKTAAVSMLSMKERRKRRVVTVMLTPSSTTQGMLISLQRRKRRRFSVWPPSNQKNLHLWLFCGGSIVSAGTTFW
jgi:hypothetical protein